MYNFDTLVDRKHYCTNIGKRHSIQYNPSIILWVNNTEYSHLHWVCWCGWNGAVRLSVVDEVVGSADSADVPAWPEASSGSAVPFVSAAGRMMPENPSRLTQLTTPRLPA